VRLGADRISITEENVPSPAPSRIQTLSLSAAAMQASTLPSLSKSAASLGLASTPIGVGARKSSNSPLPVGAVQEHAHVGAHLVHRAQVEVAIPVEVARERAVDARLIAAVRFDSASICRNTRSDGCVLVPN
jgi:hypothetical protein